MYTPNDEQLQAVIISQEIIEACQAVSLHINDDAVPVEISPLGLYCQKTGHKIGMRDENSLFSLLKMHGKDYAIWSLYNATSLNVHPAWIDTAGDDLDLLIDSDPIGYACYCFGLMTAPFYQTQKNLDPKRSDWAERHWALARANALMNMNVAGIDELNIALCRVLTFKDAMPFFFRRIKKFGNAPDTLAILHASGELTDLINTAVNSALDSIGYAKSYIHRTRFIDIPTSPEDAARGPSNIRKQRASKRSVAEASMFGELAKLFTDSGLDLKATNLPGSGAWRKRIEENAAKREAADDVMLSDLNELAKLSNLVFSDDNDDEDNDVEFRTLPATNYAADDDTARATALENKNNNNDSSFEIGSEDGPSTDGKFADLEAEALEIASDMMTTPIQPVMVEIAKAVMENVIVKSNPELHEPHIIGIITPEKPLSAIERIRLAKKNNV